MTEPDGGAILYEDEDFFRAQRRQAFPGFPAVDLDDLRAERLLALEMVVERAFRHLGGLGDVLNAGAVEALAVQDIQAGIKQLVAYIGFWHG